VTENEDVKKCPKCGGVMERGKMNVYGGVSIIPKGRGVFSSGDRVFLYYCVKCGFVELYKEMK
jgi:ribosomal protein S27AE